ncbi:hypothetical protein WN944_006345 [Citrus x changshan-huyou]|uniref:Chaperone DnaJ C-terminal domain-containing protein n=1 Tax=Citrus x changshan-huyou TaxID=2935761 RepID=A0AAP0MNT4_9ROSI
MGDRSPTSDNVYSIFGHAIGKTYKFVTKWNTDKSPTNKSDNEAEAKFDAKFEAYKKGLQRNESSTAGKYNSRGSVDDNFISRSSVFEKCASRRSHTPSPKTAYISNSTSWHNQDQRSTSRKSGPLLLYEQSSDGSTRRGVRTTSSESTEGSVRKGIRTTSSEMSEGSSRRGSRTSSQVSEGSSRRGKTSTDSTEGSTRRGRTSETTMESTADPSLSRNMSRRGPIIFSQTTAARRKPPPVERKLTCTLEELCEGSVKKITINREIVSDDGKIYQEEETLRVKLKPGWKKGTKITFEGKGDRKPGYLPADIVFSIDEKRHPLFRRTGDDLEIGVEIPLVQALTGCSLAVPLLGKEKMNLSFDEIIYPDFEKVIQGQGMPKPKEEGKRGDLRIRFLVEFPTNLSNAQRHEAYTILQDCY